MRLNTKFHHRRNGTAVSWLISILMLLLPVSSFAAGNIKCWKNAEGVRECGYQVPAEYSQQRIETINEQGMVVDVQEAAKSKEEAARDAELVRLRRIEEEKNQLLLRAYTTERDLLIARDNKVTAIQGIVDLTKSNNVSLQESLEALERRAADLERAGKPTPEALVHEMEATRRQMRNNDRYVAAKQKERQRIEQSYNEDLERFRKLKNKTYKSELTEAGNDDAAKKKR